MEAGFGTSRHLCGGALATPIPYTAHPWLIGTVPTANGSVPLLRFMFLKFNLDLHLPFMGAHFLFYVVFLFQGADF